MERAAAFVPLVARLIIFLQKYKPIKTKQHDTLVLQRRHSCRRTNIVWINLLLNIPFNRIFAYLRCNLLVEEKRFVFDSISDPLAYLSSILYLILWRLLDSVSRCGLWTGDDQRFFPFTAGDPADLKLEKIFSGFRLNFCLTGRQSSATQISDFRFVDKDKSPPSRSRIA